MFFVLLKVIIFLLAIMRSLMGETVGLPDYGAVFGIPCFPAVALTKLMLCFLRACYAELLAVGIICTYMVYI